MLSLVTAFVYVAFATLYPKPLRAFWEHCAKSADTANVPKLIRISHREIDFYMSILFRFIIMTAGIAVWYIQK